MAVLVVFNQFVLKIVAFIQLGETRDGLELRCKVFCGLVSEDQKLGVTFFHNAVQEGGLDVAE